MDENKLFKLIGEVDEKIVAETAEYPHRNVVRLNISGVFLRIAAAACFILAISASALLMHNMQIRNMQYVVSVADGEDEDEILDTEHAYADRHAPLSHEDAMRIAYEMTSAFNDALHIMRNGLASDGRVIMHNEQEYLVINDPDFPHLRTVQDIDEFLGSVMAPLNQSNISIFLLSVNASYKEIDGVLAREAAWRFNVDGISSIMWLDPGSIQVLDTHTDRFHVQYTVTFGFNIIDYDLVDNLLIESIVNLNTRYAESEWVLTFVYTNDGWRIADMANAEIFTPEAPPLFEFRSLAREMTNGLVGNFHATKLWREIGDIAYLGSGDIIEIYKDLRYTRVRRDIFNITSTAILHSVYFILSEDERAEGISIEWTIRDNIIVNTWGDRFDALLTVEVSGLTEQAHVQTIPVTFVNTEVGWRALSTQRAHALPSPSSEISQSEFQREYAPPIVWQRLQIMANHYQNVIAGAIVVDGNTVYLDPVEVVFLPQTSRMEEFGLTPADVYNGWHIIHNENPETMQFNITEYTDFIFNNRSINMWRLLPSINELLSMVNPWVLDTNELRERNRDDIGTPTSDRRVYSLVVAENGDIMSLTKELWRPDDFHEQ